MVVRGMSAALICAVLPSTSAGSAPLNPGAPSTALRAEEASRFIGETHAVVGKVVQVEFGQPFTLLHLEKPYPDMPFTGVIPAGKTNLFSGLDKLSGRTVSISGKIIEYNRTPQIIIERANQLELVQPAEGWSLAPLFAQLIQSVQGARLGHRLAGGAESGWTAAAWCATGALVAIAALLAWLVLRPRRRRLSAPRSLLPSALRALPPAGGTSPAPRAAPRVLAAGALTEPEAQALREKVVSDLTEYAKERLVQGLYSQRLELALTQQKAQQALVELEARLAALHLPMQQRIAAYEERVAELEKQLATREGEMRELIEATLLLVRGRLQSARVEGARFPMLDEGRSIRFVPGELEPGPPESGASGTSLS